MHSLILYYLGRNLLKMNIIRGQFFFFTTLLISVWPSLPTFLYGDDSLSPLCNIIAIALVKYAFMNPAITGIMPLKSEVEEPHVAIGVHHSYLVPVPNLSYCRSTAFSFGYFS